jgi:hypothetical protein
MADMLLDAPTYLGGFLFMAAIFAFVVWRAVRRDRQWPGAARSLGLSYAARDDAPLDRFGAFKIVDAVGPRNLSNVLSGTRGGFRVWLADYKYSNKLTGTVQSSGFTLCVLQHGRLAVPHFFLKGRGRPRSMTLSPQLWRPEDDPVVPLGDGSPLARGFDLRTGSAEAVLALLTPALRDLICGVKGRYLDVEAKDDTVIVTRRSWIEPRDAAAFLEDAAAIAAGLLEAARPPDRSAPDSQARSAP